MLKKLRIIIQCVPVFLIGICPAWAGDRQVCHKNDCVSVETVSSQEDMERGLMFRKGLGQNKGMLFVFSYDAKHAFWMKNMHFDLDIVWINAGKDIVYIGPHIPACSNDPCPVYTPDKQARYVLEVNSGYCAAHQWKVSDKLVF